MHSAHTLPSPTWCSCLRFSESNVVSIYNSRSGITLPDIIIHFIILII
jgi:hypothetical protein